MSFESDYQAELAQLRDMGRALAVEQPALAGMLACAGSDPDVERLLQGVAFLTARVRQRLDDVAPALIETLADVLLPHLTRPRPACSIVQVEVAGSAVRTGQVVPAGSRVLSQPIEGTRCTFTTTRPLTLLPLRVTSQRLDDSTPSCPTLTLELELHPGAALRCLAEAPLRLYVHAERATATQLALWLSEHLQGVSVRTEAGQTVPLGARAVRWLGFDPGDALVPWPAFAPEASRLLSEYLTLPAKFFFLDVHGLEVLAGRPETRFALELRFRRPPPLPTRLADDALRLHCVPVANVFPTPGEPVRTRDDGRPALLRAAGMDPHHMEVLDVHTVVGTSSRRPRRTYPAFHVFRHLGDHASHCFYVLSRRRSPVDDGTHTYLRLQRDPAETEPDDETLSLELACTNRSLPRGLRAGDLRGVTSDLPAGVSVANIAPVSLPGAPPLGERAMWHMLAHLGCSRRTLADGEALRALLAIHLAQTPLEHAARRAAEAQREAMRSVHAQSTVRLVGRAAAAGTRYGVELAESGFCSEGDAFLFGRVLHALLTIDARVNTFADLVCTLQPSGRVLRYEAVS